MSEQVVARTEWAAFVDAFSRQHDGWLVSVAVETAGQRRRTVVRDVPLHGVVAELHRDSGAMMVFTGDTMAHFVERPELLAVEETVDGADASLTITGHDGVRTVVQFRSPMRPELVDGIAP